MVDEITDKKRRIRSFVCRSGRISQARSLALEGLSSKYCLGLEELSSLREPIVLEIGFGMGHSLWQMAQQDPTRNYLGVEVHKPGVAALLHELSSHQIQNVRIFMGDVTQVLAALPKDLRFEQVQIFFPDPWPKTRHHKRRLMQNEFSVALTQRLKNNGKIWFITDDEHYAKHTLRVLENTPGLKNFFPETKFSPQRLARPKSKYEQRATRLNHSIFEMLFFRES